MTDPTPADPNPAPSAPAPAAPPPPAPRPHGGATCIHHLGTTGRDGRRSAPDRHHDPGRPGRDRRRLRPARRLRCAVRRRDRLERRRGRPRTLRARLCGPADRVRLGSLDAQAMGVAARRGRGHLRHRRRDPAGRPRRVVVLQPDHQHRHRRRDPVLPEPAIHQGPFRPLLRATRHSAAGSGARTSPPRHVRQGSRRPQRVRTAATGWPASPARGRGTGRSSAGHPSAARSP